MMSRFALVVVALATVVASACSEGGGPGPTAPSSPGVVPSPCLTNSSAPGCPEQSISIVKMENISMPIKDRGFGIEIGFGERSKDLFPKDGFLRVEFSFAPGPMDGLVDLYVFDMKGPNCDPVNYCPAYLTRNIDPNENPKVVDIREIWDRLTERPGVMVLAIRRSNGESVTGKLYVRWVLH